MKTQEMQKLLSQQLELQTGIAYAVPEKWWNNFLAINNGCKSVQQLCFPELNIRPYTDQFLFEYASLITEQLEHKCNYLKFHRVFFSPSPKQSIQWKVIPARFWNKIIQNHKINQAVVLYFDKQNPHIWLTQQKNQLQIIFCSKNGSQAFIGYFPKHLNIIQIVRGIGFQMGFIEMQQSRIMHPDKSDGRIYHFAELQSVTVDKAADNLIMAYNMEKDEKIIEETTFKLSENINSSNEAVLGDLGMITNQSWENIMNNRTMSTGAETPTFLWSEDDHGQFRVKQLFRQRKPQQIQQMKVYAEKCIKGQQILLPNTQDEQIGKNLEILAQQMIEYAGLHKKKIYKDKQLINNE